MFLINVNEHAKLLVLLYNDELFKYDDMDICKDMC